MSEPLRTDIDLQLLFKKLGHDVEEIRVRTLQNILSKLSHGVVCIADLVQERHLIIRLLEWFNYSPPVPCQNDVLNLILKLAKNGSSAKIFLDLGAVGFLSQLRSDCSDSLHPIIDDIVETLLSIPRDEDGILQQRKECVYQHGKQQDEMDTINPDLDLVGAHESGLQSSLHPNQGYFHTATANQIPTHTEPANEGVKGLKFCTFPWLSLTHTDRHVLLSTNSLLCSARPNLVATSCEFISDVVLQDFPAEIFLQRPSIVKSLLSLLAVKPLPDSDSKIPVGASRCLRDMSVLILARYNFYHDPSLYCPKQDFGSAPSSNYTSSSGRGSQLTSQSTLSSISRMSVIGQDGPRLRGDGQDRDSTSSVGSSPALIDPSIASDTDTDNEDALSLQFSQFTLPQFAVEILSKTLPILKTSNPELMLTGMQLLQEVIKLMQISMTTEIYEDTSVAGRNLTEKLSESFESLGEVIEFHHEQSNMADIPILSVQHHRMAFIVLASFTLNMLQTMVPIQKAHSIVPDSLISAMTLLVMDQALVQSMPHIRSVIGDYLQGVDSEKFNLYQNALRICSSLEDSAKFLKEAQKEIQPDIFPLALSSIPSLVYQPDLSAVKQFITSYSQICRNVKKDSRLEDGRTTLLKLLAHPVNRIKMCAYQCCLDIVKKCVNVDEAAKPHSDASFGVRFLANAGVLYEIVCYGFNSSEKSICRNANEIILHLLQSKLLVHPQVWQETIQAIIPSLPLLQSIAGRETTLSRCILGLYEASLVTSGISAESQILPPVEKFRGVLRLLFSKDESVRHEMTTSVLWHLTQDQERGKKLPSVSNPVLTDMADLYFMEHPVVLDDNRETSVFQVDGLVKVYHIYSSQETEPSLRKSAAEQIAIMMQDLTLHKAFVSKNGIEKTLAYLEEAVDAKSRKQVTMATLIPACLSILRHILHDNTSLRHQLAHQSDIYYVILRCTLLCQSDARVKYNASHLMVLLLFDEVAGMSASDDDQHLRFSLPRCVKQRYQLPFQCPVSQTSSVHSIDKLPNPDPMTDPLPLNMMKVSWNIAMHEGIEGVIQYFARNDDDNNHSSESETLHLSKCEQAVIVHCDIHHSLSQALSGIAQASSHYQVKLSLWHLSLWITTGLIMDSEDFLKSPSGQFLMLPWKDRLRRFVEVVPANSEDKLLLAEVLCFLTTLMQSLRFIPEDLLDWLGDISCGTTSVLMTLLSNYAANQKGASSQGMEDAMRQQGRKAEEDGSPHAVLHKQLLNFFNTFVRCLPVKDAWRHKGRYLGGSLTHGLLTSLNMTDALPFYDLPPLEGTLNCLVHVTARSGWSLDWNKGDSLSLCQHLLNSLVEVVTAFHVGRGGTTMSYMGKGVTKNATLCLQHLTDEMSTRALDKEWSSQWFHTRQGRGLDWLMALWTYRDPEVRAASLCIAASLVSTTNGCVTMAKECQYLPAGLWGVAFGVLMDQSECSMVREQAANLLCNLLSRHFPDQDSASGADEKSSNARWAGPQVHDEQSQVSLLGKPALLALLHHYNVYHGVAIMLQHYYENCTIQPVCVVEESTISTSVTPSGPSTVTTPGSNRSTSSTPSLAHPAWHIGMTDIPHHDASLAHPAWHTSATDNQEQSTNMESAGRPLPNFQGSIVSPSPNATSPIHITGGRFFSVVTPCLLSAVCRVLRNLFLHARDDVILGITKENILPSLLRLLNSTQILNLFKLYRDSKAPGRHDESIGLQLTKCLSIHKEIIMFSKVCLLFGGQVAMVMREDEAVFEHCLQLLQLRCQGIETDDEISASISSVWKELFDMITTYIRTTRQTECQQISALLIRNCNIIIDCIIFLLKNVSPSDTRISGLTFLSLVLSNSGSHPASIGKGKKTPPTSSVSAAKEEKKNVLASVLDAKYNHQDNTEETSYGGELCRTLLDAYDGILLRSSNPVNGEKSAVIAALKNVLATSYQAQVTALEGGFVESTIGCMRDTHAKLSMESLHINKSNKKKEQPLLCELSNHVHLLHCCMLGNTNVKMAAYQAGLTTMVRKLWAWCTSETTLLARVLSMLTTYIARCPTACSSLANGPPGQTGGSLLHLLIRQAQREKSRMQSCKPEERIVADKLFSVLGNAVWSSECRNLLWKSGFLQGFANTLPPKKKKLSVGRKQCAALWLQLLANLTFAAEGQQMVMKIPDCLDVLLEYGQSSDSTIQYLAVIILHNLCYLSANKAKLLATDNLVCFLLDKLQCDSLDIQLAVLNSLWALLYSSQKAKAVLKSTTLLQRLLYVEGQLKKMSIMTSMPSPQVDKCCRIVSSLQVLVQD